MDTGENNNWEQWYAIYVRSHFERTTEQCLRGKGYRAFSPFYQVRRKRSNGTRVSDLPLFPGYVFCCFQAHNRLPILATPGVVSIVGARNIPEPVLPSEIQSIQRLVDSGRPVQPWPFLRQGQRIRIDAGPLAGTEGTLVRAKNEFRIVVTITLLHRAMSVEVDQELARPLFDKGNEQR